jgi:zinc/manganese transport system substrate-binding protein
LKPTLVFLTFLLAAVAAGSGTAAAKVRVAASTTDLASIASYVGGGEVEVFSVARPTTDVHRVEVLPSYMVKVARADVYLKVGLGLDQWADQIIDGSRNSKVVVVDCGRDIDPLEKPTGKVDASMGDVHPNGNPHYWLDPRNGAIVAREVAEALGRVDPAHGAEFGQRAAAFAKEAEAQRARGARVVAGMPVRAILTYHASWPYLAHAFGLEIVGTVEPVPGIPPTGGHLQKLVNLVKARKVGVLLQEPYFSNEGGAFLGRETGLKVVKMSPSCDGPEAGSYLAHLDQVLAQLAAAAAVPTAR